MGFYIRKSIRVGPFRFNLSKSGVGVSAGFKGLRVGTSPRGNYIHMGRGGLYYRAALPSSVSSASPAIPPNPVVQTADGLTEIESGSVFNMVDSSATELLRELNEKQKMRRAWPWLLAASVFVPLVLPTLGVQEVVAQTLLVVGVFATPVVGYWDRLRRTTVLMYDLEAEAVGQYQKLHDAFEAVTASKRTWHLSAKGATRDWKRNAGAGTLVRRTSIKVGVRPPKTVQTNIDVPCVPVGKQTLCFFPERLLVFDSDGVGAVSYDALENSVKPSRFIEEESAPSDAQVVGHTWKYVNKSGGPDKRFKQNRQLPICLYDEVEFKSDSGLNEVIQVSKTGAAQSLPQAIRAQGAGVSLSPQTASTLPTL